MLQGPNKEKEMWFNGVHKSGFHAVEGGARWVVSSSQLDNLVKLQCFQGCFLSERRGLDVTRLFTAVQLPSRRRHLIAPQIFHLIVCLLCSRRRWGGAARRPATSMEPRRSIEAGTSLELKLLPRVMCLPGRRLTHRVLSLPSCRNLGITPHG